ncbi:sodium:solute symporter [Bacteroidota bacterium]
MTNTFGFIDWAFIIGFLVISLSIGLIARKRIVSIDDFLLVGRKLRSFRGIATLASTEMGLVTIIYFSEEAYSNGFVAIVAGIIAALTMWIIGQTGFVIKHLRALGITTVPEYFELRYKPGVRLIAGLLIFLTGVLNMGIFLQVEGKFLSIAMGFPAETLPVIMGIILVIVVSYTMLGGMHSVVITDVFQFLILLIGIVVITYFSFAHAGGLNGMVATVKTHFGDAGFNLRDAPRYGLLFIIWTALYYTSGWSSWQPVVQRVFSMQDARTSMKLYRITSIFMFFRACLPMLWGIAALAVIGMIPETQTALPQMLVRIIPAGMIGFIMIGFLAASMSTYDSYLLSFSAILAQDIIKPLYKRPIDDKNRMLLVRLGIIVIGFFIYFWGIYYEFTETVFRYIALTGSLAFAGTLTGIVGGIYWKKASTAGAYLAFIASAIPPITSLLVPEINPTNAGLLSFVLAPLSLFIGSILIPDEEPVSNDTSC